MANLANELQRYSLKNAEVYLEKSTFGDGFRSSVYEVRYLGLKCAGKKLHRHVLLDAEKKSDDNIVKRFIEECHQLSQVHHPNVVQFLGVYFQQGVRAPILVMEFLPTDLTSCIEQYGILPKEISYSIFHDVALGLWYLHSRDMMHRNLNSKKILLTSNMTAKISDLGMAKIIKDVCRTWTLRPGDPSFTAPEASIKNPSYDAYIDTFSFGIIMLHVLCGEVPVPELSATYPEAKRRERYLDQETVKKHPLKSLIHRCIDDRTKRPETRMIVEELGRLIVNPETFQEHLDTLKDVIQDMKPKCTSPAHKELSEDSQPDSATEERYPKNGPEIVPATGGHSMPSSPQEGGAQKPDTSQPKLNGSPAAEQKPSGDRYWCNVVKRPSKKPGASGGAGASGVAVMEALWGTGKETLGVKFNREEKNLQLLSKWKLENGTKMTTGTIITWANTWNISCGSSRVPRFVDVDDYPEHSLVHDIKVDFNENGVNRSLIGTEATHCPDGEFTMHLSLKDATTDSLKKHYIIHEFGHALGLGHEHQRAKFWRIVYPFVYTELMMNDPTIGGVHRFVNDWRWILESYYTSDLGDKSVGYDPDSIMHYWFNVEWLNKKPAGEKFKDYSDMSNVEKDKEALEVSGAYEVLKGLHNRGLHLPSTPSEKDIAFLKKCYETRK